MTQRGFWLTEVLLSLWLLAFVGAGLIGLFVFLAKTSSVADERAAAELLADRLVERAVRYGPPSWGLEPGQVGPFVETPEGPEGAVLRFQLLPVRLSDHRLGILYMLKVKVTWDEDPSSGRVERGRGELERHRKVYIENLEATP